MPYYPEWIVVLDQIAKGSTEVSITPRIAQEIINAIKDLQRERDDAEAELNGATPTPGASLRRAVRQMHNR